MSILEDRIGHQGIERSIPQDPEPISKIPEEFFTINFVFDGKEFQKSVDWLLRVETGSYGEVTDVDLELKISRCAYNAFVFLAAKAEISLAKKRLERDFKTWLADAHITARQTLNSQVKAFYEGGLPSRLLNSPTQQEITDWILKDPQLAILYNKYNSDIDELAKIEEITNGLHKIILEHGENLRSILFKRSSKSVSRGNY